jgi:hypothetical protein
VRPERWYLLAEAPEVSRLESLVGRASLHVIAFRGGKYLFTNS